MSQLKSDLYLSLFVTFSSFYTLVICFVWKVSLAAS